MKVLLLKMDDSLISREVLDNTYNRIVTEIKMNAVAMIPPFVKDTEVVDIDAVAFDKDGQLFIMPSIEKGELNV